MDYDQIITLLSKHFEGKTTRREELFLRNLYFENKDLYSSLKKYIFLFLYFYQAKREVFPKRIRKKISTTYFAFAASLLFLIDLFIGQSTNIFDKNGIEYQSVVIEEYDDSKNEYYIPI